MSSLTRPMTQIADTIDARAQLSIKHLIASSRYLVASPSLDCIAAITWLFNVYRPALSLYLSLGDGVAFFAGCQAVDRLQSADRVHGYVQRDDAGRDRIAAFNAANYAPFASLFDYADSVGKARYRNGSIDLIYVEIDDLEQFDLTALVDKWKPKMSGGGCIVIQHDCVVGVGGGVHGIPLPPEIAETALAIHCGDAAGLIVLPIGQDQPAPIARLSETGASAELDFVFSRLGSLHRNEFLSRAHNDRIEQLDRDIAAIASDLKASEARRMGVDEDLQTLRGAYADRSGIIARLQAEDADRRRDGLWQADDDAAREQRLKALQEEVQAALRAQAKQGQTHVEALEQRDRQLRQMQEALDRMARDAREHKADAEATLARRERDHAAFKTEAEAATAQATAEAARLVQAFADQVATAEAAAAERDRQAQAAAVERDRVAEEMARRGRAIEALQSRLSIADARVEAMAVALKARDARLQAVMVENDERQHALSTHRDEAKQLRLQIARLKGEVDLRFKETATLTLKCEQVGARLEGAMARAQAAGGEAHAEIQRLSDAVADRDRRLAESQAHLEAVQEDRAAIGVSWQAQADRLADLDTRLAASEVGLQAGREDAARAALAIADLESRLAERDRTVVDLRAVHLDLSDHLESARAQIANHQSSLDESRATLTTLEADRQRLTRQVQTLRATTSWKATAPIRNAGKAIKNLTRSDR